MRNVEAKVLVAHHEPEDNGGAVVRTLRKRGVQVDMALIPPKGDVFPSLDAYNGVVVLGGMPDSNDEVMDHNRNWMQEEILGPDKLALTVCLGYQVMATALGAQVTRQPKSIEIGLQSKWGGSFMLPLTPEGEKDAVLGPISRRGKIGEVVLFHSDFVTLEDTNETPGLFVVARNPSGKVEAIRSKRPDGTPGNALGVQWHPDVTTLEDFQNFNAIFGGLYQGFIKKPEEVYQEYRVNRWQRRRRGFQKPSGERLVNRFADQVLAA